MIRRKKKYKEPHYKLNVILMLIGLVITIIGAIVYEDMLPIGIGSILFTLNLLIIMIKFLKNSKEEYYDNYNLW